MGNLVRREEGEEKAKWGSEREKGRGRRKRRDSKL